MNDRELMDWCDRTLAEGEALIQELVAAIEKKRRAIGKLRRNSTLEAAKAWLSKRGDIDG